MYQPKPVSPKTEQIFVDSQRTPGTYIFSVRSDGVVL